MKKLFKNTTNIYRGNGSYFLTSPSELRKNRSFYNDKISPLVCEGIIESIDIVTSEDRKTRKMNIVKDYDVDNVSKKILRIILSYTDYVNRTVWHKEI